MPGWKGIVGTGFEPDEFDVYCHGLQWTAWRPSFIVLHNTQVPSLAERMPEIGHPDVHIGQ